MDHSLSTRAELLAWIDYLEAKESRQADYITYMQDRISHLERELHLNDYGRKSLTLGDTNDR